MTTDNLSYKLFFYRQSVFVIYISLFLLQGRIDKLLPLVFHIQIIYAFLWLQGFSPFAKYRSLPTLLKSYIKKS